MPYLFVSYLPALSITIIIESFIILPRFRTHYDNLGKLVLNFLLINCITNLSLNTLVLIFGIHYFTLGLELIIPIIEAYMFKYAGVTQNRKSILITCFIANLLSFIIGIFVFQYLAPLFQTQPISLIEDFI